eukprot:scaffold59603_cov35-Tisochrysis_lutea.AAC.2
MQNRSWHCLTPTPDWTRCRHCFRWPSRHWRPFCRGGAVAPMQRARRAPQLAVPLAQLQRAPFARERPQPWRQPYQQ